MRRIEIFKQYKLKKICAEHILLADGSMQYTEESRMGMIFRPYDWERIDALLKEYKIISKRVNKKNEKMVIIEK